jgi:energy-coupling factor transport system ATP-binding protein
VTDLALEGVSFIYPGGTRALDRIDLTIAAGESVAVIGQNGSGKSTLVRHLDGLLRPTAGRVLHDGDDIASVRVAQLARRVGIVFQNPDRQIFSGTVRAEVGFGPRILGRSRDETAAAVAAALAATGLADLADTNPYDLGFSRRKLLAMASVLVMSTPVLVLDEPTTGQDLRGVRRVTDTIRSVAAEGRTVIAISHDMRFVAETFERIVVMADGRIVLDGPPEVVFAQPSWPILASTSVQPTLTARAGARLGLGSTPTEARFVAALAGRSGRADVQDGSPGSHA